MPTPTILLPDQTQGILTPERGGAGNSQGGAPQMGERWTNTSGVAIPAGSLVRRRTVADWSASGIEAVASATATDVLGVAVGTIDQAGHVAAVAIPAMGAAWVVTAGDTQVLTTTGIGIGQWALPTATAGQATGSSVATSAAFGIFTGSTAAAGLAPVRVGLGVGLHASGGVVGLVLQAGDHSATLLAGIGNDVQAPGAGTIYGVLMTTDQAGSAVCDIWHSTFALGPPNSGNSICASAKPTISSGQAYSDYTLSGWTTAVGINDWYRLHVDSASGITMVTVTLLVHQS